MKKHKFSTGILYIVTILSFIGSAISYFFIKGQIAIHWNTKWEVDRYVDKKYIFLIGAIPFLFLFIYDICYKIDPKTRTLAKMGVAHNKIRFIITIMMVLLNWISVASGINQSLNYQMILMIVLGISFICLGNYLPTVKPNYFVGIRTPWALSSESCFRKSNRFGGYVIIIVGILMIISGISNSKLLSNIGFGFLMIGLIGTFVYSYYVYIHEKIEKDE